MSRELDELSRDAARRLATVADDPVFEARALLAHALGLSSRAALLQHEHPPRPDARARFEALVAERAAGVPIQYLLGYVDFWKDRFEVPRGVFIPRSDTETLVEAVVDARGDAPPERILEIGPGTGVIVLSLLGEWTGSRAIAIDRSPRAARCTLANAHRLDRGARLDVVVGDLDAPLAPRVIADLLVSNPPYIGRHEMLDAGVRDHEPPLALYADDDGFAVIDALLALARTRLREGGILALEIGAGQGDAVCERITATPHLGAPSLRRDLAGHDRVIFATRT